MLCNRKDLEEFPQNEMKIACSYNNLPNLVAWSFCAQSTDPPLRSSLLLRAIFFNQHYVIFFEEIPKYTEGFLILSS